MADETKGGRAEGIELRNFWTGPLLTPCNLLKAMAGLTQRKFSVTAAQRHVKGVIGLMRSLMNGRHETELWNFVRMANAKKNNSGEWQDMQFQAHKRLHSAWFPWFREYSSVLLILRSEMIHSLSMYKLRGKRYKKCILNE